jgi:hypothetical protein
MRFNATVFNQTVGPNLQTVDRVGFHSRRRAQHLQHFDLDCASHALLAAVLGIPPRVKTPCVSRGELMNKLP